MSLRRSPIRVPSVRRGSPRRVGYPGSRANSDQAPGVEGARLFLGAPRKGPGSPRLLQTGAGSEDGRARLHGEVTVTASIGHPLLDSSSLVDIPEGAAPLDVFRLKPEYLRKQKGNENMIGPSRID